MHRNVGQGAVLIDEIGMNSLGHLGAIQHACTEHLRPPPHLHDGHPAAEVLAGRAAAGVGDPCQHPQPGGIPTYRYATDVERNPQFAPSVPNARAAGSRQQPDPERDSDADNDTSRRRPSKSVPQHQDRTHAGFRLYRTLAQDVFELQTQQRQDRSAAGILLTDLASMYGGGAVDEQRVARLVDALNARAIRDAADLAPLNPRVVLQRNEPRHALNTRLLILQAHQQRKRLVVWNADHVQVRQRGANPPAPLTRAEQAAAMRAKDADFQHTTADTWYFQGARYILLDTITADAGAHHNNQVEACGLLVDPREPPDNGHGPYWRLQFLPTAVLVRPIDGHSPRAILNGLGDLDSHGGAFAVQPRASSEATILLPALTTGTAHKQLKRINVPLGDYYAATDFYVQGRSFGEQCWVIDLTVPPGGIKRATLYVLLTRFKSLAHIRLLRPLYTTPHERTVAIRQFLKATQMEPDLAAELRLLRQTAAVTRQRYAAEFEHACALAATYTRT